MKRLVALILGGLGLGALLRRRQAASSPSPAEDLRARLAESRATAEAQVEDAAEPALPVDQAPDLQTAPAAEEAPAPVQEDAPDVDARRAEVHARAREALDELKD